MRKSLAAAVAASIAFSAPALRAEAYSVRMDAKELVQTSDVIVLGTFAGTTSLADGRVVGRIDTRQTLKGQTNKSNTLHLNVPQPGAPVSSSTILFDTGQSGLWFLRRTEQNLYSADHPQRFVPDADAAGVLDAIGPFLR